MCQQSLIKHFQEQLPLIHSRALEKKIYHQNVSLKPGHAWIAHTAEGVTILSLSRQMLCLKCPQLSEHSWPQEDSFGGHGRGQTF